MKIKEIVTFFLLINGVASVIAIVLFDFVIFLNLQMAFLSSLFIVLGSFIGYRKNILKQSEDFIVRSENERDVVDGIDDKFDLYGEINENELTQEEIQQIVKDEKKKISIKDSLSNTMKSFSSATSIYRIFGYLFLVFGFFYLNNNQFLNPLAYLCGFLIIPIMALVVNFQLTKKGYGS